MKNPFSRPLPSLVDRTTAAARLAADSLASFRLAVDGLVFAASEAETVAAEARDVAYAHEAIAANAYGEAARFRRQAAKIEEILGLGGEVDAAGGAGA